MDLGMKKNITLKLDAELHHETIKSAEELGVTISEYVRGALRLGNKVMKVKEPHKLVQKINKFVDSKIDKERL